MGSTDRLVTLSGTIEEQMRATDLIVSKLSEDPHYTQSMNYPFSYPSRSLFRFSISLWYYIIPNKKILNAHLKCVCVSFFFFSIPSFISNLFHFAFKSVENLDCFFFLQLEIQLLECRIVKDRCGIIWNSEVKCNSTSLFQAYTFEF